MFLLNSRLGHLCATPSGYKPYRGTPSPEVTGLICRVPSAEFSQTPEDSLLDYLCRFAVRAPLTSIEAFLGSVKSGTSSIRTCHHSSTLQCADLPTHTPYCLDAHIQQRAYPILLRPPISQTVRRWYRNINLLSIAYAYRPRLRSRLTLSGRAFLRKP